MNKDYKAKLLEKAGIYIDCCQLLKCVYKLLSKFKNVLYWNSEKNSFSTKELKHS